MQKGWELVLENSATHRLAEIDLEKAEIDHLRATAENLLDNLEANQKKADEAWKKANKTYRTAVQNLQVTYLENYVNMTNLMNQLEIRKIRLKQAETAYENGLKKWEIKSISDSELRNLKLNLESAQSNLANTENQIELAKMDFAALVGSADWEFDFRLEFVPFAETLEDVLKDLPNLERVVQARDQLDTATANLEEARTKGEAVLTIRERELEVEKAKINLKNTEEDQLKQLIRSYNTLKQSEKSYLNALDSYEVEQKKYEVALKQHSAGVITDADLENSRIALMEQENSLRDSLLSYYKSYMSLQQLRERGEFSLEQFFADH